MALWPKATPGQLLDIAFQAIPCQEASGVRIVARCKKNVAAATRRTIAPLHFSFVHHVECAMRTIKIIASELRHSIIGAMTQTYP